MPCSQASLSQCHPYPLVIIYNSENSFGAVEVYVERRHSTVVASLATFCPMKRLSKHSPGVLTRPMAWCAFPAPISSRYELRLAYRGRFSLCTLPVGFLKLRINQTYLLKGCIIKMKSKGESGSP